MRVSDVCRQIENFAPLSLQESYDNAGLLLGNPEDELKGVLICLDVSEAVVDEAIALNYNMIVAHHPLIFRGLKHITGETAIERCVIKAIQHQIAVYAGHTNVDSVINGVNTKICEKLGLKQTLILVPKDGLQDFPSVGSGMIGVLPQAMNELDFLTLVKNTFHCKMLRHTALSGKSIQKVAVCGGSGSEFIDWAVAQKADAFITADIKYHAFAEVPSGLLLIDAGHYETEQYTKEIFFDLLSKNISTFAIQISKGEQNPVNYI